MKTLAAPIVPVLKQDGGIRIGDDFKLTVIHRIFWQQCLLFIHENSLKIRCACSMQGIKM